MSNGSPPPPPPPPSAPPPQPSYSPPPGGQASAASSSSGLPTWAKVGIGCGCLVLLIAAIGIGLLGWGATKLAEKATEIADDPAAIAKTIIQLNPELEVLEEDSAEGTMTIRNVKTGETTTIDYSDIEAGNFSFEGPDGKVEVGADAGGVVITDAEGQQTTIATDSSADNGGMKITTSEGVAQIGGSAKLPSWLPSHPEVAFSSDSGMVMTQGETASGMVSTETPLTLEKLEEWYTQALGDSGFEVERNSLELGSQKTVILSGKKTSIDSLQIMITDNDGKRQVAITYNGPAN